jgi:hypothetical protein
MMWEIAGGIVIAVLILNFLPLIIEVGLLFVMLGVLAALGYLAWWFLASGAFDAFAAAHPLAVFGAIGLVIAVALVNANRETLSRVRLPDLRPAFFTEYPALSRALLLVLFAVVLIGARAMGF